MKKAISALAICVLMLVGCTNERPEVTIRDQRMPAPRASLRSECIFTIEGCEYYVVASYLTSYVHKGNCKNPIHRKLASMMTGFLTKKDPPTIRFVCPRVPAQEGCFLSFLGNPYILYREGGVVC